MTTPKLPLSFTEQKNDIENILNSITETEMVTNPEMVHGVYAIAQIKATLLLAEQVKRVGELLAEKNEEDLSSDSLDFVTRLYSVSNK